MKTTSKLYLLKKIYTISVSSSSVHATFAFNLLCDVILLYRVSALVFRCLRNWFIDLDVCSFWKWFWKFVKLGIWNLRILKTSCRYWISPKVINFTHEYIKVPLNMKILQLTPLKIQNDCEMKSGLPNWEAQNYIC